MKDIRARAFWDHAAQAIEKPQQELDAFIRLIEGIDKIQQGGRDPRETLRSVRLRRHYYLHRFLYYSFLYFEETPWRCYFQRNPLDKTALGFLIFHEDQGLDVLQPTLESAGELNT